MPSILPIGNRGIRTNSCSIKTKLIQQYQIIVSTYQILLDALTHGFVKIKSLALIVLDEGKSGHIQQSIILLIT